jgi:hypothetical protein
MIPRIDARGGAESCAAANLSWRGGRRRRIVILDVVAVPFDARSLKNSPSLSLQPPSPWRKWLAATA